LLRNSGCLSAKRFDGHVAGHAKRCLVESEHEQVMTVPGALGRPRLRIQARHGAEA
jgi:hypothetical protein